MSAARKNSSNQRWMTGSLRYSSELQQPRSQLCSLLKNRQPQGLAC
jgi:hypothetical protein